MRPCGRALAWLARCPSANRQSQNSAFPQHVAWSLRPSQKGRYYSSTSSSRRPESNRLPTKPSSVSLKAECLDVLQRNRELSPEEARVEYGWILAHLRDEVASSGRADESERMNYERLRGYCARRGAGEPLQYVLGSVDFGPLTLLTRAPVFIPRPETAHVIDRLADLIKGCSASRFPSPALKVLDVCTGSGSLALLLAHHLRSKVHVTGIDINPDAVELAQDNAKFNKLGAHAHFKVQDVWALQDLGEYDMLVSNPPYIPRAEWDDLASGVKDYEDPRALIGDPGDLPTDAKLHSGSNSPAGVTSDGLGLDFYRKIAVLLPSLRDAERNAHTLVGVPLAAVEIGPTQADDVTELFQSQSIVASTDVWRDQFGRDRLVLAFAK